MITEIQFEKDFNAFQQNEVASLEKDILSSYPYPLSLSYKHVIDTTDPLARLSVCMKDMLHTLLQYLALLMLHDYANSKTERSFLVFTCLETMIYRPGPGKWLGFLREIKKHYRSQECEPEIKGIFTFLDKYYDRKGMHLKLKDGQTDIRLPVLEALVTLRNRWAHSKHLTPQEAAKLCDSVLGVFRHIYSDLGFLKDHQLLLAVSEENYVPLSGYKMPDIDKSKLERVEVYLGATDSNRPLMRLFLHVEMKKNKADLLLFEEFLEEKHVLYSSSLNSLKYSHSDSQGQMIVESISGVLERVRVESEFLRLDRTDFDTFASRCNTFSSQMYSDFKESGKYNPQFYVPPDGVSEILTEFLDAPEPVLMLSGEQGTGKSALMCHWTRQLLGLDEETPPSSGGPFGVFLFETHRTNVYEDPWDLINHCVSDSLHLEKNNEIVSYLEFAIKRSPDARIVFIFDAINEFETKRYKGLTLNRCSFLLDELFSFINRCRKISTLREKVKFIVTLRWDLLTQDGLSPDQFESEMARDGKLDLFYGADPNDRLFSVLPALADTGTLYKRIQRAGIGMSPIFKWIDVPKSLKSSCSNPMLLQIFMRAYDGCQLSGLDAKNIFQLEDKYIKKLFQPSWFDQRDEKLAKKERGNIVSLILQQMSHEKSQFITLNPSKSKNNPLYRILFDKIFNRARIDSKGKPLNNYYTDLVDNNVIREDLIKATIGNKEHAVPIKRLGFMHELLTRYIITTGQRKHDREFCSIFGGLLSIIVVALFILNPLDVSLNINHLSHLAFVLIFFLLVGFWVVTTFRLYLFSKKALTNLVQKIFGFPELLLLYDFINRYEYFRKLPIYMLSGIPIYMIFSFLYWQYLPNGYFAFFGFEAIAIHLYSIIFLLFVGAPILSTTKLSAAACCDSEEVLPSLTYKSQTIEDLLSLLSLLPLLLLSATLVIGVIFYWKIVQFLNTGLDISSLIISLVEAIREIYNSISVEKIRELYNIINIKKIAPYIIIPILILLPIESLWNLIIGLTLIWIRKKKSTIRRRWPEDKEQFMNKTKKYLTIIFFSFLAITLIVPFVKRPALSIDVGTAKVTFENGIEYIDGKIGIKLIGENAFPNQAPSDFQHIEGLSSKVFNKLDIENTEIKDLSPLRSNPDRPNSLYLANNPFIKDYTPLLYLSLDYLKSEGDDFQDISFLDSINDKSRINKSLNGLELIDTKVEDLKPLLFLDSLKYLDLTGTAVKDTIAINELLLRGVEIVGYKEKD
ncbi:hypothetical protein ACFL4P_02070 [Gemmatimonadota bacterium]